MANRSAPAFPSQFESQTSAQRSLGRLKRVLSPDTQLISELEDKLAKSEKEKNAQRDTVATLHEELGSLKEEEQTLKQKIREQDAELDRLMNADEAEGLHVKYMATKNRLENAVAELKWTQKELWKAKSELVELKSNRPIKAVKNACTQTERDVDPDTSEDDCAQTSGELPIPYAGVDIRSISLSRSLGAEWMVAPLCSDEVVVGQYPKPRRARAGGVEEGMVNRNGRNEVDIQECVDW
ncbi:hypothetical protein PM082_018370 [Marasmius tenuissimus]|nr:hypothetical protein PM082_018370 [Marasmius tenuissimus]